jgi:SAM-dependent methyltransferase
MQKLFLFFLLTSSTLQASIEHKDEFIDVYLSNISSNMDEKTQLIEHIKKNPDGMFIDIGTGGDAIAIMAKELPDTIRPTLIAADLDPLVIQSIRTRRKEINQYIDAAKGPKVELITMSAANMVPIKTSTIAGIGASALAHEVYSYTPAKSPLDQFIGEICRVLEKEGVFVYRDPKWVDDPKTRCIVIVKEITAKYYTTLFLAKFLDRQFSMLRDYRDECCKPQLYSPADVKVNVYLYGQEECIQMDFKQFLDTASKNIDYSKNFSIEAPKGLIAEVQRHYLMFLKDYYAAGFINAWCFKNELNLEDLSKEEAEIVEAFALRKSVPIVNGKIAKEHFPILLRERDNLKKLFVDGFRVDIAHNKELLDYIQKMSFENINRNLFYLVDDHTLVIDPKVLVLLFHGKGKGIFQFFPHDKEIPHDLLEHLKLEGEEHYFYKTTDELITYMGQFSRFLLKDTHKRNYLLAPIDVEYIKTAPRNFYQSILKRDLLVMDKYGTIHEPVTDKNIIHFRLQPESRALEVYKKIGQAHPNKYPMLNKWVEKLSDTHSKLQ